MGREALSLFHHNLEVRLLGPVEVVLDRAPVPVTGRRVNGLLAVLALSAGEVVSTETIIDRLWGVAEQPVDPRASLHTVVRKLRGQLGAGVVRTGSGGYQLAIDSYGVDVVRFGSLLDRAGDSPPDERALLVEALALWRGTPLEGQSSEWLADVGTHLVERYLSAWERRLDLDLEVGDLAEAVGQVRNLANQHPHRESLWVRLLRILNQAGRRAEALDAYETIRTRLAEDLGVDPGRPLQEVFSTLLAAPAAIATDAPLSALKPDIPRQLPPDPGRLVGRGELLARLDGLLAHEDRPARIVAIHGPGGVGKTSLTVHWAHRIADSFPDGQLFVDLRGFGPVSPMPTDEALAALLCGLGVDAHRIPQSVDARSGMLRTLLTAKRVLIVLDNARDAQQIRPLLPGGDSLVVLTSRSQVRGLAAREGAVRVEVDFLGPEESAVLLRDRLGRSTLSDAELAAFAEMCGHLPLALVVAAECAERDPQSALRLLAAGQRDIRARMSAFESAVEEVSDLRVVFSWSYDALEPEPARMFRLLGMHPGGGICEEAAAAVAGVEVATARRLLDRLTEVNLVFRQTGRWSMHDLVLAYAMEVANETDAAAAQAAFGRLVNLYVHTSYRAGGALLGDRGSRLIDQGDPDSDVPHCDFSDPDDARAWFDREWRTHSLMVGRALEMGRYDDVCRLAYNVYEYGQQHRPSSEVAALQDIGVRAAEAAGRQDWQAALTNMLALSAARTGDTDRAEAALRHAWMAFGTLGHQAGEEIACGNLAAVARRLGRHEEAIELAQHAITLSRQLGHTAAVAMRMTTLARALARTGRTDEAVSAASYAVEFFRANGDDIALGMSLRALGVAYAANRDFTQARRAYLEALDCHETTSQPWAKAVTLFELGQDAARADKRDLAQASLRECLSIIDAIGHVDRTELTRTDVESALKGP